jgi:hypothetical protein
MKAAEEQLEENQENAEDIKPFRTASIMINR